ncbi:hypothetical protein [Salarchaeum sp. JOR-1]|uniref:hypothetical protein n=1 Tax=Salarchaeum sp. JOR-1 TaxID=2599399 RepID=UPI0011988C61|nr:hypothetical protein [Salarchaeum sp. JOR-1]QDX39848.1 hypothetical protein FQU85_02640 [Salarchaeum sp. JOR-1]
MRRFLTVLAVLLLAVSTSCGVGAVTAQDASTTTTTANSTTTDDGATVVNTQLSRGVTVQSYEYNAKSGSVRVVIHAETGGHVLSVADQSGVVRAVTGDGATQTRTTARRVVLDAGRNVVNVQVSPVQGVAVFSVSSGAVSVTWTTGAIQTGTGAPVPRQTVLMLLLGSVGLTAGATVYRTRQRAEDDEFQAERVN